MSPTTQEEMNEMKTIPYRSLIGCLMHLMVATRPDIANAVGILSRFMNNPGKIHWKAAQHVLKYLKQTKSCGLRFSSNGASVNLEAWSDSDWGSDIDTRRSTNGYITKINGNSISWNSKIQKTPALSTAEAEYMALTETVKEVIWLRKMLDDFSFQQKDATTIYEDNQSCIAIAKNPVQHARTKHIDIQYHFTRTKIQTNDIQLQYCPTDEMLADLLTKPLPRDRTIKLRNEIGIIEPSI
jgi:hypothetical protein